MDVNEDAKEFCQSFIFIPLVLENSTPFELEGVFTFFLYCGWVKVGGLISTVGHCSVCAIQFIDNSD